MLKSDLLIYKRNGETIVPKKLEINNRNLGIATEIIDCFQDFVGKTQGELDQRLHELEGDSPDYRVKRGLAHLLRNTFSTFEIISPLEPPMLRERVFSEAAKTGTLPSRRSETLEASAHTLSDELKRSVSRVEIETGLYADLQETRI